jgi:hypothetical protein
MSNNLGSGLDLVLGFDPFIISDKRLIEYIVIFSKPDLNHSATPTALNVEL